MVYNIVTMVSHTYYRGSLFNHGFQPWFTMFPTNYGWPWWTMVHHGQPYLNHG